MQEGYWDQDQVLLTVQMVSTVQIFAGVRCPEIQGSIAGELKCWLAQCRGAEERVRFFIERDQDFKLPGTWPLTRQKTFLDVVRGRPEAVLGISERSVFSIGGARGAREVLSCVPEVRQVLTHSRPVFRSDHFSSPHG